MINIRHRTGDPSTTVTFSLEYVSPVSVVGDFNGWDPLANPLDPQSNGLRSAAVDVPDGMELRFRYLADGGHWFDDPDADRFEPNGFGQSHGVVVAEIPPAP